MKIRIHSPLRVLLARLALAQIALLSLATSRASLDEARSAFQEQRHQEAKTILEKATAADDTPADAYYLLALAEGSLGNPAAAEEAIKKAIAKDSENAEYRAQHGSILVQRAQTVDMMTAGGMYMAAVDLYKKAVSLDDSNLHAHIGLCRYYSNAPEIAGGSLKKAKDHADAIERIAPHRGKLEHALIAEKSGQRAEAIKLLEAGIALQAGDADLPFELGKLHQANGDLDAAKAAFEAAIKLSPSHQGAVDALAQMASATP